MANKSQHQGALVDQLAALIPIANKEGLYDASDYIANVVKKIRSKDPEFQKEKVIATSWRMLESCHYVSVIDIQTKLRKAGISIYYYDIVDILREDDRFLEIRSNGCLAFERKQ